MSGAEFGNVAPPAAPRWDAFAGALLAAGALGLAAGALLGHFFMAPLAGLLLFGALAASRPTLPWSRALVVLLLVIVFVPIRRYRIPGDLPFQLEPYRVLVALIVLAWVASLLVDPRVRLRRSGFDLPVVLILGAVVASIAANGARVSEFQTTVLKSFTFFLSFVLVFYVIVSVVRTRQALDALVKTLVGGGAVVGVLAVLEARAGITPFTRLHQVFPFLTPDASFGGDLGRAGAVRAYGPAEHPIALGAALVLLVPLATYLIRSAGPRWWLATGALAIGVLSTVSRTGVLMLVVVGLVFLWLRPRETRRLWPLLVPLVVLTHFAVPGTLGSLRAAFLPQGGLVEQQRVSSGDCNADGRIADLGPTLAEVGERPFLGHGFGTRIVTGPDSNACILDNQWLGTLVDVGVFGAVAWLLLFLAVLRRLGRIARETDSDLGWLFVAVVASIAAYAVGMFTFDALGFTQVTFFLFVLLGLGAAAVYLREQARPRPLL
jgi:O-antigen ligase